MKTTRMPNYFRMVDDHFGNVIQFLSIGVSLVKCTTMQKKQSLVCGIDFQLISGKLYKLCLDEILRRYVLELERSMILAEAHDGLTSGHYVENETARKILRASLWCLHYKNMSRNIIRHVIYVN